MRSSISTGAGRGQTRFLADSDAVVRVSELIAGRRRPHLLAPAAERGVVGHAGRAGRRCWSCAGAHGQRGWPALMDEVLLYAGMPRTLYRNNAVPPKTHIGRALGGPILA
ncbi:MAG: hypothetical protein R2867_14945 [Caldilineaceae bacterium]